MSLAEGFGHALARAGWTTVSGLARGIDAAAHRGTLRGSGRAVAVLGSGVDVVYPVENTHLYRSILAASGAIISEYPQHAARPLAFPGTQPAHCRHQLGCRGGRGRREGWGLITARLAAEMGRPVLVVPGDIDRPASVGCNRLVRDGAHPVLGVDDLMLELELILGRRPKEGSAPYGVIPANGVPIDDLPEFWRCSPGEALARLARMELSGEASLR